jgi:hypothetical protein
MDDDNWRNRIETLGIVGVIASLIFVGLEIRQNTTATKAAAIQEMTASNLVHMDGIAGNSQLVDVLSRGTADIESLTDAERSQFLLTINAGLMNTHGLFRQWELGVLPDEDWAHWKARICDEMQMPVIRLVWAELKSVYVPTFVDAIEACDEFSEDLD